MPAFGRLAPSNSDGENGAFDPIWRLRPVFSGIEHDRQVAVGGGRTCTPRAIVNLQHPAGVFSLFMNNPAFPVQAIFAGSLALSGTARGADSVVLGHGIANQYYASLPCPADSICLDAQYRWELEAARTIVGPLVKGRVRALISQHTDATRKFVQSVELFVLRPIQDPALREASGAQYYLVSLSPLYEKNQYCLSVRPSEVGLAVPESQIIKNEGSYCFPGSLLKGR